MKAKKALAVFMGGLVMLVVAAFLALHSINLFTFVFPPDQQQWAWLGFGLTGLGAIGYLLMFLFWSKTTLQKVVSIIMTFVCSVGEVLAAFFGMQIESWKKSGWALTQNDVQTMLMVVGILAITHFIALIIHFAGDKVIELFLDDDGDGTPNIVDPDWRGNQKPISTASASANGKSVRLRTYTLPELLGALKISRDEFREYLLSVDGNPYKAWTSLEKELPADLGMKNFSDLARAVVGQRVNP